MAPSSQALKLSLELENERHEAVAEIGRGEVLEAKVAELELGETGEFPWPDESLGGEPSVRFSRTVEIVGKYIAVAHPRNAPRLRRWCARNPRTGS